jgi:hypothetical protein
MKFAWVALATGWLLCAGTAARGADAQRGREFYEARCDLCHNTSVHARAARTATSFDDLRRQVARWDTELGAIWSPRDVDDVTVYLNNRYYRFPCPESVCGGGPAAGARRTPTAG